MSYDVFISHAAEDKAGFVAELADALRQQGLTVWYDDFTLRVGDSLTDSVNKGIAESAFGIVVFSPYFLRKRWPQLELNALLAREYDGEKVILPIWHNVSRQDIMDCHPIFADKLAADSRHGIDMVVAQLLEVIKLSSRYQEPHSLPASTYFICFGKVAFYNIRKGFGNINGEDGKEYFVHLSGIEEQDQLAKDDVVVFLAEKGDRGVKAISTRKVKKM